MKQVVSLDLWWPEARADEELVYRQLAAILCFFEALFQLIVVYSFLKIFASNILAEGKAQIFFNRQTG